MSATSSITCSGISTAIASASRRDGRTDAGTGDRRGGRHPRSYLVWIDFADLDPALVFQMRAILRRCDRRLQARFFDQEVPADDFFRLRKRTIDDPPVSHRDHSPALFKLVAAFVFALRPELLGPAQVILQNLLRLLR